MEPSKRLRWDVILFTCLLIDVALFLQMIEKPTIYLSSRMMICVSVLLLGLSVGSFCVLLAQKWQAPESYRRYIRICKRLFWIAIGIIFMYLLFSMQQELGTLITISLAVIFGLLLAGAGGYKFLRQKLCGAERIIDFGVLVWIVAVFAIGMVFLNGLEPPQRPIDETYTVQSEEGTVEVYHLYCDALPLMLEDLCPGSEQVFTARLEHSSSIVLDRTVCYQNRVPDQQCQLDLCYEIVDMKVPGAAAICQNPWQEAYRLFAIDEAWHLFSLQYAQKLDFPSEPDLQVYQFQTAENQLLNDYLICRNNRVVLLHYDGVLGAREWEIVIEKLQI